MSIYARSPEEWLGTPAQASDPTRFAKVTDFETFGERLAGGARSVASDVADTVRRPGQIADVYDAARRQAEAVELSNSARLLTEGRYDGIIAAVERASGVKLQNPARGGYWEEAGGIADQVLPDDVLRGRQAEVFDRKIRELRQSDKRIDDAVTAAEIDFAPAMVARRANEDLEAARRDATYLGSVLGMFGGGAVASFRDPIVVESLALGGGASAARTVAGRIAEVVLREAAINAGATALQQPFIQANRSDLGLTSGVAEALENVALGGAVGGLFGGSVQGVRELARVFRSGGSAREISTALREAGVPITAEDAETLAAAVRAERADLRLIGDRPDGASPIAHIEAVRDAVSRAEGGSGAAFPDLPHPTRPGATDEAAVAVLERPDLDPLDALDLLRRDPDLVESAMASGSPAIREAGRVALLGDDAFGFVLSGEVDPRHAALVQRAAVEPERQAAMMADLAAARPATMREAREVIEAAQSAVTARNRVAVLMGVEPSAVAPDASPLARVNEAGGLERDGLLDAAGRRSGTAAWREARGELDTLFEQLRELPAGAERDVLARRYLDLYGEAIDAAGLSTNSAGGTARSPNVGSNVERQTGSAMTPPVWATSTASTADQSAPGVSLANALASEIDSTAGLQSQLTKIMTSSDDVRGFVPLARADGTVELLPRGMPELAGERDLFLGDLVAACKVL